VTGRRHIHNYISLKFCQRHTYHILL